MKRMMAICPNGEIHTPYGATEALPVSSIAAREVLAETARRTEWGEGTCVGRPLPGVSVRVIVPVDGPIAGIERVEDCAPGVIGELIVRGPSVTRGYDALPQADAASKIPDGDALWHRMGDMGWIDGEGRLWFCGRKAELVATGEGPLYTDCCEAIFNQHPKVARSALIDLGEGQPGLVIEPMPGAFPRGPKQRARFIAEMERLAAGQPGTRQIKRFFFERHFPVDVRHNAKIHRLSLARKYG
jgi:acyl-CoA synthetase (AMP-forming)/AMP-acid ligase II